MTFDKRACIIFLACVAIIICAIFAWRSHQALNATNKERARILTKITSLTTRIHTAESDLAQATADWEDEQAATTAGDHTAIFITQMLRSQDARRTDSYKASRKAVTERLNSDPKHQEIRHKEIQLKLAQDYGPYLAREHLTPDQIARLKNALMQREMDTDDLKIALESQDLPADSPSGLMIKQQSDDALRQAAKVILGPDDYARFDAYDRQKTVWDMMGAYAAKSTGIGAPVTLNQVEQLVDYIAKNNPDYQNGKAVNTDQTDWSAVEEYARTIMTPDQFDIFTNHNADHVIWQKLNRALDAIIIDAARQNAGTPPSQ